MLTTTHQHALLKTKSKKNLQNWKKSITLNSTQILYTYFVLRTRIQYTRTLFYVLKFDISTLLNLFEVHISNLSA